MRARKAGHRTLRVLPACNMAPDSGGASGGHGVKTIKLQAHGCPAKEELAQCGEVSALG